jgi:[protein-PII] uridylyltransferase
LRIQIKKLNIKQEYHLQTRPYNHSPMITLKQDLKQLRHQVFSARDHLEGSEHLKIWTQAVDAFLIQIIESQCAKYSLTNNLDLVGLGGYGRMEFHPYSDVDLLVLYDDQWDTEVLGQVVQPLWDTGLKLGLVMRQVSDCKAILGQQLATDIAFLDRRLIHGCGKKLKLLEKTVLEPWLSKESNHLARELISAIKISVYATNDSLYRVEPHLKDSIGALRDLQRVRWILQLLKLSREDLEGFPQADFHEAINFILKLRSSLHMICGRRLDVLEVMLQNFVAEDLGYGKNNPDLMLQDYYRHAETVCYACRLVIEKHITPSPLMHSIKKALGGMTLTLGVDLIDSYLWPNSKTPEKPTAKWMMELFLRAAEYQVNIGMAMRNYLQNAILELKPLDLLIPISGEYFMQFLNLRGNIAPILFIMHETGFLEKIIPEMKGIRCKVHYTSYHEFAVDRHSLLCVAAVDELLNENSEIGNLCRGLPQLWILRMGLLLHDIGKSQDGDHAITGSVMTQTISRRFGWLESDLKMLRFLVYQHLTLSKLAFRREPEDHILQETAKVFPSPLALDYLYLLTILDIQNVGQKTWTTWKGLLLAETYHRLGAILSGDEFLKTHEHTQRIVLLGDDALPEQMEVWKTMVAYLHQNRETQFKVNSYGEVDEITVVAQDRQGLCADMMACIISEGYDLLHAVLRPLGEGVALQVWYAISDGSTRLKGEQRLTNIRKKWQSVETKALTPQSIMMAFQKMYPPKPTRNDVISHENKLIWLQNEAEEFTVLEVHTKSRQGLVYALARTMTKYGLSIAGARISTRIDNAEDVFYLHKHGQKFNGVGETELNEALHQVISD